MEQDKPFDLSPDDAPETNGEPPKEPDWPKELAASRNWVIKAKHAKLNDRDLEEHAMLAHLVELQGLSDTLFTLPDNKRPAAWEEYADLLHKVASIIKLTLAPERP